MGKCTKNISHYYWQLLGLMKTCSSNDVTGIFLLTLLSSVDLVTKTWIQLFSSCLSKIQSNMYFCPAVYESWWMQLKMLSLLNCAFMIFNVFLFFFWTHKLRRKYVISHAKTIEITGKEIVLKSQQIIFLQHCMLRINLRNDPQEATCERCAILIYLFLTIRLIMGIPLHSHYALLSFLSQFYDLCPRCTLILIKGLKWSIKILGCFFSFSVSLQNFKCWGFWDSREPTELELWSTLGSIPWDCYLFLLWVPTFNKQIQHNLASKWQFWIPEIALMDCNHETFLELYWHYRYVACTHEA